MKKDGVPDCRDGESGLFRIMSHAEVIHQIMMARSVSCENELNFGQFLIRGIQAWYPHKWYPRLV